MPTALYRERGRSDAGHADILREQIDTGAARRTAACGRARHSTLAGVTADAAPHPPEEVRAAVERYHAARRRIDDGLEPDGFASLADFYTDDAVYVDAAWGRIEGKAAIAHWLAHSMVGLEDWRFPIEFTAVEGDDVVVKWTQVIPGAKADGSPYTQSAYSRLRYSGAGKFCYEEDTYNMVHVLEDVAASGWRPSEPMNAPPQHPDRNWSLPEA